MLKKYLKKQLHIIKQRKNRKKYDTTLLETPFIISQLSTVPYSDNPEVSIIIPVYNQLKYTLNCLWTIVQNQDEIPKEIIIINDNSTDKTLSVLSNIKGLKIINNEANLGFLKSVNKGIDRAKGEYIYLLNNDTKVQRNYLTSLLDTFKLNPNVGAVGSKLIFSNNLLQEAGCLIFKDSNIVNLGREKSPNAPEYNFLKEVYYCSGCSLLFKKHSFQGDINFLDEIYVPAYYEETDLCMKIKFQQNLKIYYQPLSEIVHYENISHNNENKNRSKDELMLRNNNFFKERWNHYFKDNKFIGPGELINKNTLYNSPSILILEEYIPQFDKDSGSNRFLEIVKILRKQNFKVYLCAKNHDEERDSKYIQYFQQLGVEVIYEYINVRGKYISAKKQILNNKIYIDLVWIFRPEGYKYWKHFLDKNNFTSKIIYDMVDIHFLRLEREKSFFHQTKRQKKNINDVIKTEREALQNSDAIIAISDREKKIVEDLGVNKEKIYIISNIHEPKINIAVPYRDRKNILFIGGFYHKPNVDAVTYLRNEIMPLVWEKDSSIKVDIVGAYVTPSLRVMENENFIFHGFQEDVEPWFTKSRIFVAPLRYGAGVKGKIGQALEYQLPIITTNIGIEGMRLTDGKNVLSVNEGADVFAEKILELYYNEELWTSLKENSKDALEPFSIKTQEENILKLISFLQRK